MTRQQDRPASSTPHETQADRLTRNLNELLQELRVTQTGVQILTGFMLTVPFSSRFPDLDQVQRRGYLAVLCVAVLATAFLVSPVAFHRLLFRGGMRHSLVRWAHRAAGIGLSLLALATCGVIWLVFDVVTTRTMALVAGGAALVAFGVVWLVVPLAVRAGRGDQGLDDR